MAYCSPARCVRIPSLFPKSEMEAGQPKRQGGDDVKMGDVFGFWTPEAKLSESCELHPEKIHQIRTVGSLPLSQSREDVQTVAIMKMGMMVMLTIAAFMS